MVIPVGKQCTSPYPETINGNINHTNGPMCSTDKLYINFKLMLMLH